MSEPADIEARLDAIERHVRECRAAVATLADGDATVMGQLGEEVDALAREVAALRAAIAAPEL
jgi:prefoldin subunit 5